jgi:uncharacterized sodium:solute symporter family permease YidK
MTINLSLIIMALIIALGLYLSMNIAHYPEWFEDDEDLSLRKKRGENE